MYVEQTAEGFNIMSIPGDYIPAIITAIETRLQKTPDPDLTKEDKRFLRMLTRQLDEETRIQV